jgi:hypothetical protein
MKASGLGPSSTSPKTTATSRSGWTSPSKHALYRYLSRFIACGALGQQNIWEPHVVFRYGAKAAAKLATVRGKDFRHEKTKRKRSYVGGKIDMSSHSIKFSNSDDDS